MILKIIGLNWNLDEVNLKRAWAAVRLEDSVDDPMHTPAVR